MNEIQIIQGQLATERLHFSQVAGACAGALEQALLTGGDEFSHACTDYFGLAVTRLEPGAKAAVRLEAARAADPASIGSAWREFLQVFSGEIQQHFAGLDARLTRSAPVTQWRAMSKVDADTIFAERALYDRVKATLPSGITLCALSASVP
jgi:hypothetical protein